MIVPKGSKPEDLKATIATKGSLIQKIQDTLRTNPTPKIATRKFTTSLDSQTLQHPIKTSKQISTNESGRTTQRTRAQTPLKDQSRLRNSFNVDEQYSFRDITETKSVVKIEGQETTEHTIDKDLSPIRIINRKSSPRILDKLSELDQQFDFIEQDTKTLREQPSFGYTERRDDSAMFLNQNVSAIEATKIEIGTRREHRTQVETSTYEKKFEDDFTIDDFHGTKVTKIASLNGDILSSSKRKWSRLSTFMKSLMLFQREEVKSIDKAEAIQNEINNFNLRKWKEPENKKKDLSTEDFARDAFQLIRRVQVFCDCAKVGSQKHIELMKSIIDEDPKRFMFETTDSVHLLNRKNNFGHTPLYIAAKNGNLAVVKLLLDHKVNYTLQSQIDVAVEETETPLEAAVRWSHEQIVDYLLERCSFEYNLIKKAIKTAQNPIIKTALEYYMRIKFKRRRWSLFGCFGG